MIRLFELIICSEMDANGRDSTRTLVIDGKVAFHEIHTYNDDANLVRLDPCYAVTIHKMLRFQVNNELNYRVGLLFDPKLRELTPCYRGSREGFMLILGINESLTSL